VTGKATDARFAVVTQFGICFLCHGNHRARNVFMRILIAGEVTFDVAMIAADPSERLYSRMIGIISDPVAFRILRFFGSGGGPFGLAGAGGGS
jgi:hypothetical protein